MKKLFFILALLFSVSAIAQVQDTILLAGKYSFSQSGGGSGFWQASGNFTDESGLFEASNIQVGDLLCFTDAGVGYYLPITEIVSATHPSVTVKVSNVGITNIVSLPTTLGAICRPSVNVAVPSFVSGLPNPDMQTVLGYFSKRVTSALSGGYKIKPDTIITATNNTQADLSSLGSTLGGRALVTLIVTKPTSTNANPALPNITDTLLRTKIKVKVFCQTTSEQIGMFQSDLGFVESWDGTQYVDKSSTLFMSNDDEYTFWPVEDVNGYHWAYSKAAPAIIPTLYTSNGTIPSGTTRDVGLGSTGSLRYRTTPNNSCESKYMYDADDNIETGSDWYLRAGKPVLPLTKNVQIYHSNYAQKYNGWTSNYSHQLRLERTAINSFSRILSSSAMNIDESEEKKEARLIIATDSTNLTAMSAMHMRSFVGASPRHQWAGLISNSYGNGGWGNEQARFISYSPSFKVQTNFNNSNTYFDWLRIDNLDTDTTSNRFSLYNGKYTFPNARPSNTLNTVNVLKWTGTGSEATPSFDIPNNLVTGTARVIPYLNTGGRLHTGNVYFKLDTTTTSGAMARVRLLINNPTGLAGEGDSYSALSVAAGDATTSMSILNMGDQALTNASVGYNSVMQLYRSGGTFSAKTNLANGNTVGQFAWRGQANNGSRALGHIGLDYTGDGTSINSSVYGSSAVSGTVVKGWLLDNQSRFWLGSGADDYYMPTTAPTSATGSKSALEYEGTGSSTIPKWMPKRYGAATTSTDASGDIVVTFGAAMPDATYLAFVSFISPDNTGLNYSYSLHSVTSAGLKIRVMNASTGAAITSTSVTYNLKVEDF